MKSRDVVTSGDALLDNEAIALEISTSELKVLKLHNVIVQLSTLSKCANTCMHAIIYQSIMR